MASAFVWFHNSSDDVDGAAAFYEKLLGWKASPGPGGMTMLAGEAGPLAGVGSKEASGGWIPYAQVDDVVAATKRAVKLGATVVKEKTRGPAGEYTIVRDPGGASIGLWQKA